MALNFIIAVRANDRYDFEPLIGEVRPFGFNFAPVGWTRCDGELFPIMQNTALFSVLDTAFGGDGVRSFAVPDLREAYPFQPAKPEERGKSAGARPGDGGTSAQMPLLVVNYCMAVQGTYPPRPA